MQNLEKMAAKLWETARKLPPGTEQHALLEQIRTFRTKLSAVTAKQKQLKPSIPRKAPDSPSTTLGSPLVSPGVSGCDGPADRRQRIQRLGAGGVHRR
jgi:hypothetical protein